jgi:hypothetical protein
MASAVDIANSALTKLGESRIISLLDDTKPAREINAIFALRRDSMLRAYNWNFAMERTTLPALSTAPSWGYSIAYQLPSDCLRVVQVNDIWHIPGLMDFIGGPDDEPYKIEGRTIVSDIAAPLKLRYIKRNVNYGEYDATFVEVLAIDLAFHTCTAITGSGTEKDSLRQDKRDALKEAVRANAIELPPQLIGDDSWIAARFV